MGSIINGPIIKFSIDEATLVAQVQAALAAVNQQVVAQNKQVGQSIASQITNPLIAQAAQLRALYSTGSIALKDLQVQQRALISALDVQIKQLATRNDLDNKSLATLKQLTLERERQANALSRGIGVGVTSGTGSALSLVSSPIIANISRLSAGLLGVAGGSQGGGGAAFTGAAAGITGITAAGGPAIAILGALTAALIGAAGASVSLATAGGELVQRLSNISQRTGISIQNLQTLEAVAKTSGLGLEDVVVGFRKFSQALSGGADGLDSGDGAGVAGATKKAAEILQVLGVTSKDSFTAIEQVADAFQTLPDGPLKAAAAIQLFGRSGLQLIPILNQGSSGVEKFRAIVEQFGPKIGQDAIQSQLDWQLATVKLGLAFDDLRVKAVPLLDKLTELANSATSLISLTEKNSSGVAGAVFGGILGNLGNSPASFVDSIGAVSLNLASVPVPINKIGASAVTAGSSLDSMFKIAEDGAKKISPNMKALTDLLDGSADALKKLIEEGTKELQALDDEQAKSGFNKLSQFNLLNQKNGNPEDPAAASNAIFAKQREDLESIADTILQFPQFAQQAQGAISGVTGKTIADLEKLADEALKKINADQDAQEAQQIADEKKLSDLILGVHQSLEIARVAATRNAVAEIIAEEQKRLDDTLKKAQEIGASEQQLQDLRVSINQEASDKIQKLRQEEINKTTQQVEGEAGKLFDALINSGGNFTKQLKSTVEGLFLQPVKSVFSAVVGGVLTQPIQAGKDLLVNFGKQLKDDHPTGILNSIGKGLAPESAIGNNTSALGKNTDALTDLTSKLGGAAGASGSGASGALGRLLGSGPGGALNPLTDSLPLGPVGSQLANLSGGVESLPLPLGNVSQELANLTGVLTGTNVAGSTAPNALGTILTNLTNAFTGKGGTGIGSSVGIFGGAGGLGSLIYHGFGGSGSPASGAGSQLFNGPLGQFLGPALTVGSLFAAGGRGLSPLLGGLGSLAAGGIFGKGTGASISGLIKDPSSQGTLGLLGLAGEGAGIALAGHQTGGVLGALEGAGGGALAGAAIGSVLPVIGTAIGAAIGGVLGLIGGIFGQHGPTQQQINNAMRNQYIDPNTFASEQFSRSAGPTIGQTLNTNFAGYGTTFGNASIPSQPPPPPPINGWGNPVTINVSAIDSQDVADFLQANGPAIAKVVGGQINTTQSGLARNIKAIVSPA